MTASLKHGLVGAWCPSVTGATGFRLIDKSGYNNHGTLTNMTSEDWVSSNGLALDFDGSDDYIAIAASKALSPDNWTISFHSLLDNVNTAGAFIAKRDATVINYQVIAFDGTLNFLAGKKIGVLVRSGVANSRIISTANDVIDGNKKHIAVTWNLASNTIAIYVNGISQTLTTVDAPGTVTAMDSATPTEIGANAIQSSRGFFLTGKIDDIRLYNRVLTPPEIRQLASKRGIGLAPRPRHYTYYQFPSASRRRKLITGMP